MTQVIINVGLAALFAVILIRVTWMMAFAYAKHDGSVWDRLLAAGEDSATKLVGRAMSILASGFGLFCLIADQILGAPEFQAFVQAYVPPQYLAAVMLGIFFLLMVARDRTLRRGDQQ